jgi:hypothetical protein
MANIINGTDTGSGGLITTGDSSDELQLQTAETARVTLTNTAVVVNEGGNDVDFRVEGDTDANLLFVDAGNDKTGVGTNAPVAKLDVSFGDYQNAGALRVGADIGTFTSRTNSTRKFGAITAPHYDNAEANLCIVGMDSQSATNSVLNIGGGSSSFNSPKSITFLTSSDGASAGTAAATFNASGNLAFPNGQGIDFSASAGGGATSSVLDDYEEGTWTPAFTSTGGGETISYSSSSATYTKIGNRVICNFDFTVNTVSGGSGNTRLTGLPFTSSSTSNPGALIISYYDNWVTNGPAGGNVNTSNTLIDLRTFGAIDSPALAWSNVKASTRLIGTVIYPAA